MEKPLDTKIQYLKGVGFSKAKLFNKIGIKTVEDLFYYFPRRYSDRSCLLPISQIKEGQEQTIGAQVLASGERHSWKRRGFSILEVVVGDSTGKIFCVWFNQPYLKDYFKVGKEVLLYGRVERYSGRLQMNSPEFEIISEDSTDSLDVGRIIPIYTLPERLTQRYFRHILKQSLDEYVPNIEETLPYDIRQRNGLLNLAKSFLDIHFPPTLEQSKQAYRRLAFEEFFLFQIPILLRKLRKKQKKGIAHKVEGKLIDSFYESLGFSLTSAQIRVIKEIKQDMIRPVVMNRLLQGDVGSGKTVVATIAAVVAIQGGYQAAFMVPTEILAKQHYENIKYQISTLRLRPSADSGLVPRVVEGRSGLMVNEVEPSNIKYSGKLIRLGLVTSSINKKEKEKIYQEIKEGKIDLIIGTHALLEANVEFKSLGLVVIDEQHKFGVGQRALLPKKGINPDVLIMTATPIPRTLAITLYGDLDISVIDELPPGRKPVATEFVTEDRREEVYKLIERYVKEGRQVYIIYPIIEESYTLDLNAANKMYNVLRKEVFKKFNVGLVHGQMNTKQQDKIMSDFKNGKIDILVATTVLEVGIDVPNASIMVIEHPERFGLSQLHQLRGRIGRGKQQSHCILISQPQSGDAQLRIKAMVESSDGFRIAEEDLRIRGPGEFFGKRQHGLSELKIANPLTQLQLLKRAREEARRLISSDPNLEWRQNLALRERLKQKFPDYDKYATVG